MDITKQGDYTMASNTLTGKGRKGAVKGRSQFWNSRIGHFIKRNTITGKLMDVKKDGKAFKGVRREK